MTFFRLALLVTKNQLDKGRPRPGWPYHTTTAVESYSLSNSDRRLELQCSTASLVTLSVRQPVRAQASPQVAFGEVVAVDFCGSCRIQHFFMLQPKSVICTPVFPESMTDSSYLEFYSKLLFSEYAK